MLLTTLTGPRNGVNATFTLASVGVGLVCIVSAGRLLKQVAATPGPFEFTRDGTLVTVGTPPLAGAMLFAYVQPDATLSLAEVPVSGLQNNSNVFYQLLTTPIPFGTSLVLFKNGAVLEPVLTTPTSTQYRILGPETAAFEPADFEALDFATIDEAAGPPLPVVLHLGQALSPADTLRAFVACPATALLQRVVVAGNQDSANTRYTLVSYVPATTTEPTLWVTIDGLLQARTLTPPLAGQYLVTSPIQFVLGIAPAPSTALEVLLIGSTVVQANSYQFTLEKLSRRVGIWLARGLDEVECEEVTRETYREYMEMYQWSFLMYDGAFTTAALKTQGTVQLSPQSRTVQGSGTAFHPQDVGMRLRFAMGDPDYEVTAVDPVAQRLEIHPAYAGPAVTAQSYTLMRTEYDLGVDVGYVFTMAARHRLTEVPLSTLNTVDPTRSTTGEALYFAYRGRSERDELRVEIYPLPTSPTVIRYTAIRREALADSTQALRGVETLILNGAAAAGCRIAMAKGGKQTAEVWMQLMQSYEAKAAQLADRLDALDWTRSDVAKVQGMRGDTGTLHDGWYEATHDTEDW